MSGTSEVLIPKFSKRKSAIFCFLKSQKIPSDNPEIVVFILFE